MEKYAKVGRNTREPNFQCQVGLHLTSQCSTRTITRHAITPNVYHYRSAVHMQPHASAHRHLNYPNRPGRIPNGHHWVHWFLCPNVRQRLPGCSSFRYTVLITKERRHLQIRKRRKGRVRKKTSKWDCRIWSSAAAAKCKPLEESARSMWFFLLCMGPVFVLGGTI